MPQYILREFKVTDARVINNVTNNKNNINNLMLLIQLIRTGELEMITSAEAGLCDHVGLSVIRSFCYPVCL